MNAAASATCTFQDLGALCGAAPAGREAEESLEMRIGARWFDRRGHRRCLHRNLASPGGSVPDRWIGPTVLVPGSIGCRHRS